MYGIIFPILWIDSLTFFLFIFYINGMNHILQNSFVLRIVIKVKIAVNIMSFGWKLDRYLLITDVSVNELHICWWIGVDEVNSDNWMLIREL